MLQRFHSWRQDHLLQGVVKSSSYLFSSNALSAALSFLQGIFAVRLLGADGYGLVSGTVIVFASNIQSPALLPHERGGGQVFRAGTVGKDHRDGTEHRGEKAASASGLLRW